jgi:hypothetical protein
MRPAHNSVTGDVLAGLVGDVVVDPHAALTAATTINNAFAYRRAVISG